MYKIVGVEEIKAFDAIKYENTLSSISTDTLFVIILIHLERFKIMN